jgi:hypothetical protein
LGQGLRDAQKTELTKNAEPGGKTRRWRLNDMTMKERLNIHREIERQNKEHEKQWKEEQKNG